LPNDLINPLFDATVQATEEAIINAMVAAETMEGINGNKSYGLPHQLVVDILKSKQDKEIAEILFVCNFLNFFKKYALLFILTCTHDRLPAGAE
jgi:hypothetical protein